jgi:hypothetical protein
MRGWSTPRGGSRHVNLSAHWCSINTETPPAADIRYADHHTRVHLSCHAYALQSHLMLFLINDVGSAHAMLPLDNDVSL